MSKQTERMILQIYNSVYKKILTNQNVNALKNGDKSFILNKYAEFSTSIKYDQFAKDFSQKLAKAGLSSERGIWRKYYQVARESHTTSLPYSYKEYERKIYESAIKHNFELIKSIPRYVLDVIEEKAITTLIEEVANGKLPRGAFKKELDKHGSKKSKLIARTESAKLQSAITQDRAINIGSVAYEWIASSDQRTRESHRQMDGVIVFWRPDAQKPLRDNMRGNAGEFPNCRCYPSPILDERDLKKSSYKVYDYRNDAVKKDPFITLTRKQLLDALQRKYL